MYQRLYLIFALALLCLSLFVVLTSKPGHKPDKTAAPEIVVPKTETTKPDTATETKPEKPAPSKTDLAKTEPAKADAPKSAPAKLDTVKFEDPGKGDDFGKGTKHFVGRIGSTKFDYYVNPPVGFSASKSYGLIVNWPSSNVADGDLKKNSPLNYARRFHWDSPLRENYVSLSIWYTGALADPWSNSKAVEATKKTMDIVCQKYSVDPKRIYLLVFSAGGGFARQMVWGKAYTKDTFPWAGVMLCSAVKAVDSSSVVPKDLPILIEVGSSDMDFINRAAESDAKKLKSMGYKDVEYVIVQGQGHEISDAEYKKVKPGKSTSGSYKNGLDLITQWLKRVDLSKKAPAKPAATTAAAKTEE
jgi:predicted esterase